MISVRIFEFVNKEISIIKEIRPRTEEEIYSLNHQLFVLPGYTIRGRYCHLPYYELVDGRKTYSGLITAMDNNHLLVGSGGAMTQVLASMPDWMKKFADRIMWINKPKNPWNRNYNTISSRERDEQHIKGGSIGFSRFYGPLLPDMEMYISRGLHDMKRVSINDQHMYVTEREFFCRYYQTWQCL